ncbi:helicase [Cyanobium sp. Cruz CV13-4-11]|uniref:helicase-related protein n=1 Tax=unclassified Cyanobium TaxID=2627006 RepID=UPI0020CF5829|nr:MULTISPECIES: helicase-related protein [unclassified Cyanobium]MCP9902375.1 helicase [Cyanobium sp. Cruz CV11-17]MCP9921242.1 helicase [Cyanobium sp. Cruz CV13-4-11]
MATSADIRSQLVAALHSDLIGPGWDDVARRHEQLPQPPSVWFTTGFLVPHVFQQEAGRTTTDEQLSFSDLAGEEPSSDATHRLEKQEKDDDANDALDQANTRRSWFTSSCGLSFILERGSTIEATVSWGDDTAPADGDDEKLWLRSPQRQGVTLTIAGEGTSPDIPLEANPQGLCLRWIARRAPSKLGYPSDQLSVSLFLLNKREPPKTNQIRHRDPVSAFQVELSLQCPQGFPPRRDALQQAAKDPDERLAALQYRRDYCFASGHNVAVIASAIPDDNPSRCHTLTTTWLPTARVYRTLPEPPPGTNVPMGMEALADLARSERIGQELMPMVTAYRAWITQQPKHPIGDQAQNETAKQLRAQAEACATRIENGIKLLADPLVREAFRTMNLVMARASRQRSAFSAKVPPDQIGIAPNTRAPKWRFFQLAFVLMNLPGLATPDTPEGRLDREAVELLFFPTGGGKTEAYLGLAAFLLVHRRLQSPGIESAGITVLMRPNASTPPPKIIASTATVRRAEAQIKALFARSQVRIFPPPGPERDDNFFSRTIPDPDQARLYVGLSAPGRNLKGVLLRSYLGLMAAAQKGWNDNKAMGANNPADPYMTLLGYFSNLKELGVTRSILEDELGAQLEQFAKNRGLAMEGFENPFASRKRPCEPEELTSRVNTARISSTKDRLSKPYIDKDHLDVALATNMISVGLDISRLGLMVVLNQPKTAAEYIQATSRVGRQLSDNPQQNKPGLVLVLLNPNRPRDRSHFELFPYWHQTFYRHVEATSCTPFASRALDRGLPGVVVAMARHGDPALAGAKGAMAADALQGSKAQIAKALQERCIATGAADDSLDEHLPTDVRDHVIDLLEAWWKLTQEPEAKLQYWTHEEKGAGAGFLHTALDNDPIYQAEGYKQFTTNWSLRDVEPSAPIRMVNFKEEITADD